MNQYVFSDLSSGMTESLIVEIGQDAVDSFIALSGDASTVHLDDAYAQSRGFRQRLVHGALLASYMSQLIGMKLPGKHGVLRSLSCAFRKPCYVPDRLTFTGVVKKLVPSLRLVALSIEVRDSSDDLLVTADAESVLKM
jgi:acyl dehydratase